MAAAYPGRSPHGHSLAGAGPKPEHHFSPAQHQIAVECRATGSSPAPTVATITSQRLLKATDSTDFADGAPTGWPQLRPFIPCMKFKAQDFFLAQGRAHIILDARLRQPRHRG